jgi:hypothetical protein
VSVWHLYPRVADWPAGEVSDAVNPRSHGPAVLLSPVARAVRESLLHHPGEFAGANRGLLLLASQVRAAGDHVYVEFGGDPALRGLADGGTTDAVLAALRAEYPGSEFGGARVHVEVIDGLRDPERAARAVAARNTSRQVSRASLAHAAGRFDWLKAALPSERRARVAFEENAGGVPVADALGLLSYFRPSLGAPTPGKRVGPGGVPVVEPTAADRRRWLDAAVRNYRDRSRLAAGLGDPAALADFAATAPAADDVLWLADAAAVDLAGLAQIKARETASVRFSEAWDAAFPPARGATTPYHDYPVPRRVAPGWVFPVVAAAAAFRQGGRWLAPLPAVRDFLLKAAAAVVPREVQGRRTPDSFARAGTLYEALADRAAIEGLAAGGGKP